MATSARVRNVAAVLASSSRNILEVLRHRRTAARDALQFVLFIILVGAKNRMKSAILVDSSDCDLNYGERFVHSRILPLKKNGLQTLRCFVASGRW